MKSFDKCVRPQRQQSPKQTRARLQISERFISCTRAAHLCRNRCQTPRRDILAEANDWTVAADLEGRRHYPQVLIESGKRPDLVLVSSSADAIILVELTVPWEDRLQYSTALKADKYADLSMDLEAKVYRTDLFPSRLAQGV